MKPIAAAIMVIICIILGFVLMAKADTLQKIKLIGRPVVTKEVVKDGDEYIITTTSVSRVPITKIEGVVKTLENRIDKINKEYSLIKEVEILPVNWTKPIGGEVDWDDIQSSEEIVWELVYKDSAGGEVYLPASVNQKIRVSTTYEVVTEDEPEEEETCTLVQ